MLKENIKYVESIKRFGIRSGLDSMKKAMVLLDNPERKFESVHITGTNGKGSTSTFIANILKEAGYKVGLYLSPYVNRFNERIQINGEEIKNKELDEIITRVRRKFEEASLDVTFFEFITATAFLYFAEKKIDIAVVEVGMGGRLDATNVINSEISVITNIGLDHQKYLGNTKEEITFEKAGIIKENSICVTAEDNKSLRDIIKLECEKKKSKFLYVFDCIKDIKLENGLDNQIFSTSGIFQDKFKINLLGEHQIKNALTAVIVANELNGIGKNISIGAIKKGLENTKMPGRLEIVSKKPLILVDGAHNPPALTSLEKFIGQYSNKKVLLVAFSQDRDAGEMLEIIAKEFENIIVTKGNYKPQDPYLVAKLAEKLGKDVFVYEKVNDAVFKAKELAKEDDLILVTGSFYMIGEALKFIK